MTAFERAMYFTTLPFTASSARTRAALRRYGATAVLLAIGLTIRLWTLREAGQITSDEALPGLMALHIAAGREAPVFYYGQNYFGALEAYLLAALFRIAGFHPWLLVAPALVASLLLIPCTMALAKEVGEPSTAWLAALPLAVPPPPLSRLLLTGGAGFSLAFLLQGLVLLCVLRALRQDRGAGIGWWLGGAALGAGLLCWVWQSALPLCAVLVAVLLWQRPLLCRPRNLLPLAALAAPGLAPPLQYNLTHHFATLTDITQKYAAVGREAVGGVPRGLSGTVSLVALAFGGGDEALGVGNLALAALALCAVPLLTVAAWQRRGDRGEDVALAARTRWRAAWILAVAALVDVLAAHGEARQIVPAALLAYVCLGALPSALFGTSLPRLVTVGAVALAIAVPTARSMEQRATLVRFVPSSSNVQLLVRLLEQRHLEEGYSDYWSAYPVTYFSGERTIVAPLVATIWGGHFDRYPAYTSQVNAADPSAIFLLLDRRCSPFPYLAPLDAAGAKYRVEYVGAWTLISQLSLPAGDAAQTMGRLRDVMAARNVC